MVLEWHELKINGHTFRIQSNRPLEAMDFIQWVMDIQDMLSNGIQK